MTTLWLFKEVCTKCGASLEWSWLDGLDEREEKITGGTSQMAGVARSSMEVTWCKFMQSGASFGVASRRQVEQRRGGKAERRKLVIIHHATDIVCSLHCQIIDCYDLNESLYQGRINWEGELFDQGVSYARKYGNHLDPIGEFYHPPSENEPKAERGERVGIFHKSRPEQVSNRRPLPSAAMSPTDQNQAGARRPDQTRQHCALIRHVTTARLRPATIITALPRPLINDSSA